MIPKCPTCHQKGTVGFGTHEGSRSLTKSTFALFCIGSIIRDAFGRLLMRSKMCLRGSVATESTVTQSSPAFCQSVSLMTTARFKQLVAAYLKISYFFRDRKYIATGNYQPL